MKKYDKCFVALLLFALVTSMAPTSIFATASTDTIADITERRVEEEEQESGSSDELDNDGITEPLKKNSTREEEKEVPFLSESEQKEQYKAQSDGNEVTQDYQNGKDVVAADRTVKSNAELINAIAAAPTDGTLFVIEVTDSFSITSSIIIKDAKNILLRSDSTQRTLTRGAKNIYLMNLVGASSLSLENIVIDGNKEVYSDNTLSTIVVQGDSKLSLNSGTILKNNIATTLGGAIYIVKTSEFHMDGASIIQNEGKNGGAVWIHKGNGPITIEMSNSVISGNKASSSGGGLYSEADDVTVEMTNDSQIVDNTAGGHGGGICVRGNATIDLKGDSAISRNVAGTGTATTYFGGGIYATTNFTLQMSDTSQINDNENKKGHGGGIYCTTNSTFSIQNGASVDGNVSTTYGGGIYATSISSFVLQDSSISNNTAASNSGGGIYSELGFPLTVKGSSKINGNSSGGYGGGIAVVTKAYSADITVSFEDSSELIGNSAKYGGAFWLGNTTIDVANDPLYTLNISGNVKIQDNTAEDSGGIYIRGANAWISTSTPISGNSNTASDGDSSAINMSYGNMTLDNGVEISENTGASALLITNTSTLTMQSGSMITKNVSNKGGAGLRLNYGCTLDMKNGSVISKNTVTNGGGGGGVYLYASGGTIAGELSENVSTGDSGGAIYVHGNTAITQTNGVPELSIVDGAEIKSNVAAYTGGGIYVNGPKTNESVDPRAIVHVKGGNITGNTANGTDSLGYDSGGGGLAVARGQAIISGGNITENVAKVGAGGVQVNAQKLFSTYIGSGKLTISGGNIYDNISGDDKGRYALGIQGLRGAEITLTSNIINKQAFKVDASSTLVVEEDASFQTIGTVTLAGKSKLITFDPNGGEVTNLINFIHGETVKMPPVSAKHGHSFGGWYDGSKIYQPNELVTINNHQTYKAIWKYNVNYKTGEKADSGQKNQADVKYDDIDLVLLNNVFTRKGHQQIGWATSDNGPLVYSLKDTFEANKDLDLYPVWDANTYTVSFDSQGGSSVRDVQGVYGEVIKEPIEPRRESFTFKGWYQDKACKTLWDFSNPIEGNITLYARWGKTTHYDVSGEITGTKDIPSAYLIRNGVRYSAIISNTSAPYNYRVDDVPSGTYNLVVSAGSGNNITTTTTIVTVHNQSIKQDVVLPANNYNSIVNVIGDKTPNVEAGGLDKIVQTVGDSIPNINKVTIELRVKENENSQNAKEVLEAISQDSNYMVNGLILDLNLVKIVNHDNPINIKEITYEEHGVDLISVTIHLPDELKGKSGYALYRFHDEQVDKITTTENPWGEKISISKDTSTITALIKKFSTYSIAYSEPYTLRVENGSGSGTYANKTSVEIQAMKPNESQEFKEWEIVSGSGILKDKYQSTTTFTLENEDVVVKAVYQDKKISTLPEDGGNVNTGDTTDIPLLAGLAIVSGIILVIGYKRKRMLAKS